MTIENPKPGGAGTIISLQYLRGIAALLVVYFHAALQASGHGAAGSPALPVFGASGVDIFFVLSGYVMWITTAGRRTSPADFLRRRVVRIVPLYWLVTLVAAAAALLVPGLLRSTRFDAAHLLASLFFIPWPNPGIVAGGETLTPVVVPGWTLNMEMFFYVLFALVLPFAASRRIAGLLLLLALAYLVGNAVASPESPAAFYGSTIIFEFWLGVMLAALLNREARRGQAAPRARLIPLALCGLWLAGVAALVASDWGDVPGPRVVTLGLPALVIVGSAIAAERLRAVPHLRWLEELGNSSYSLYLTHGFVVAALRVLFARTPLGAAAGHPVLFVLCAIGASIVVGLVTYHRVEKPLVQLASRRLSGGRRPATAHT